MGGRARRRLCAAATVRRAGVLLALATLVVLLAELSLLWRPLPPGVTGAAAAKHVVLSPLLEAMRRAGPLVRGPCVRRADVQDVRVLLVTGSTKVHRGAHELECARRMRRYAEEHGYTFRDISGEMRAPLPGGAREHWGKVAALKELVGGGGGEGDGSWVWWMDLDVLVMNRDVRAADLLGAAARDPAVAVAMGQDDEGINSGVMLWHRTAAGRALVDEWWSYAGRPRFPRDQKALRDIFNRRAGAWPALDLAKTRPMETGTTPRGASAAGFVVLRQCALNSTPLVSLGQETYFPGDFLIHFYSLSRERKARCVLLLAERGQLPDAGCV